MLTIMWFRQDLRLADNPALSEAVIAGDILPVYILDDINSGTDKMGGASRWWLHESLVSLNASLDNRLHVDAGDPLDIIPKLVRKYKATGVFWNRCYEPWRIKRDSKLKQILEEDNIAVSSFNGSLLFEPWQLLKGDDTPYKVFTPFYRKAVAKIGTYLESPALASTSKIKAAAIVGNQSQKNISRLKLLPEIPWFESISERWNPGEKGAKRQLQKFLKTGLGSYKEGRDYPAMNSVSQLSAHLHFGELSPRQVLQQLRQVAGSNRLEAQAEHFVREIFWREFSYYLLYHFPTLTEENLRAKFDRFPWLKPDESFDRWCSGTTGYPIVDAGMRELWQTGYMHNRVRMIVASFLVKNLLLDWRLGAAWFWDCLVDADLANNSCSWQWVAGSGADAAPFFRIFNPIIQGEKFDAQGTYVRKYLPEIAQLPDKYIHKPSAAPDEVLLSAGVELGKDYPKPLVDLKQSRERALEAYQSLKT